MENKIRPTGIWSVVASFILMIIVAIKWNALGIAFHEITLLLQGRVHSIPVNNTSFLFMFAIIFATITIELPLTLGLGAITHFLVGETKGGHSIEEMMNKMGYDHHFMKAFISVMEEELTARWIFLGILPKLFPFLSGTIAFYVLFFLGNGLWALRHLYNYREERDQQVLRVLPQFVSGVFLTYVFVKYGLLASVLMHFASNAIVLSFHKLQRWSAVDILQAGYSAVCVGVSFALIDKPVSDILPWFSNQPTFALPGWEFCDYVKLSVFLGSWSALLLDLLMYDKGDAGQKDESSSNPFYILVGLAVIFAIIYGTFWLLGFVITSVPYRVLVLAILLSFLQKGSSGSAMARVFWSSLPDAYIAVCIFQAVGFWLSLAYVLIESLLYWPRKALAAIDD